MKDESERLYEERQQIQVELEKARQKKMEALDHPDTIRLVNRLLRAEKVFDPRDDDLRGLRKEVDVLRREISSPERDLKARLASKTKELELCNRGEITSATEALILELSSLKTTRKVIARTPSPFGRQDVEVLSNEDSISQIRKLVQEGISRLNEMRLTTASQIRAFTEQQLLKIRAISTAPQRKIIEGIDYERREFVSHV